VRFGVTPEVNAVYTLIMVVTISAVLVSLRFTQRR
jgi:ABC-type spermidine/putrescine transport system permease subunit II